MDSPFPLLAGAKLRQGWTGPSRAGAEGAATLKSSGQERS
jgi:hypothetical protein